ncbi:MAG: nucleotidyltransferase family protein [Myxococcaceae bacterium]
MKAMILCAGLGTRLRPLTERWPKPAIPLLGQPLFRYTAALLARAGIKEVGINTHHLPEEMERTARAECERLGQSLTVVREPQIQGTGGGIRGLRKFLEDDSFVVFNGDILFAVDLVKVIAAHRAAKAAATMVLLPMPEHEKFAAVECTSGLQVKRIAGFGPGGEGLTPWHFSGVHVMTPAVFDFMKESGPEDINREVYMRLMEKGLVLHGAVAEGYWSDLGTPARYLATQQDLLSKKVPLDPFGEASPFTDVPRFSGGWARGPVEGWVKGPAFIEANVDSTARVGAGVYVGSDIPAGAELTRTAVLPETPLKQGEQLQDCIAWKQHRIAAA